MTSSIEEDLRLSPCRNLSDVIRRSRIVITFSRILISTKQATSIQRWESNEGIHPFLSRRKKYFDKILKYSSPEKLGYSLPNLAQYILWVKGIKIYTYAEPRTIYIRKNIKVKVTSICVHSKLRNLLQNNLANFYQPWR